MNNSFHESSRKELEYEGNGSNRESLNFSALRTFDSSEIGSQSRSNQRMQNIPQIGTPQKRFSESNDEYLADPKAARNMQKSESPILDISPMSSISTDESFPSERTDQLSIFRPKFDIRYGEPRDGISYTSSGLQASAKQHSTQSPPNMLQTESVGDSRHSKYDSGNVSFC